MHAFHNMLKQHASESYMHQVLVYATQLGPAKDPHKPVKPGILDG